MSPTSKSTLPLDIYVRVSQTRGRDGDSFQSPAQQEERCRLQLAADGLEVGEVFVDLDQSGGKSSRPAFDKAMERAKTGVSGGIIVHDLSRFGRYESMPADVIALENAGAMFVCCAEKIDTTTSSGRFFLRVMSAMAVMYREQAQERVLVAQKNAVGRGVHISAYAPPGYLKPDKGKGLVPDPVHGPTVTEAFAMAARGEPYWRIADMLTERRFPSGGKASVWRGNRVVRILRNPVYKGQARYGSMVNEDGHEPLVDATTWALAQRTPKASGAKATATLLAGICRCSTCRYALHGSQGGKHIPVYEDKGGAGRPEGRCPSPVAVSQAKLDEYVLRQAITRWETPTRTAKASSEEVALLAVEAARGEVEEVVAMKSELRPVAFAAAYEAALAALEEAERAVPRSAFDWSGSENQILDALKAAATGTLRDDEGETVEVDCLRDMISDEQMPVVRAFLREQIQAVLVARAASRSNKLPVGDRVTIVWAEDEPLELPRRGQHRVSLTA